MFTKPSSFCLSTLKNMSEDVIKKSRRGGARAGAGRKPKGNKPFGVRLKPEDHELFIQLGGSAWLTRMLQEVRTMQHMLGPSQKAGGDGQPKGGEGGTR
jgi:hypothetical protein